VAEAHALTARFFARVQVESGAAAAELDGRFAALHESFAAADDDLGLSRLYRAEALVHWLAGQATKAEAAWARAVHHARRAGDDQGRADALCWLASAAREGPMPVPVAIARCEEILGQLHADRLSQALTLRPLASLHAMAGRFDHAHELLERATSILDEVGASLTAAACVDDAFVALLEGEPDAAEAALRSGCADLEQMGERALLGTTAALLAHVLVMQARLGEAWACTQSARKVAADDDLSTQILWRGAAAQVLARRGDSVAAERLSAEAVALAAQTDWLSDQGDALMVRADVLRSSGDVGGAAATARAAMDRYERKGNLVAARRAKTATAASVAA
jgi:ATP/maltotriose-dependent transcriptional regulator MalT